ncbi:MAG TPA: hypothetical protein VIH22_01870 [Cyclobacteriaceae bacterium]|jgi:hypothetical protein
MEKTVLTNNYGEVKLSDSEGEILELIKKLRNDLIRDFLDERFLRGYVQSKYHHSDISNVKVQFIRKGLKELYASNVNLAHYKPLIEDIRSHERTSLSESNELLFYRDVESIFERYIF